MAGKTENMQVIPKRFFRIQEAAQYLGLSPRTLYNGVAPRSKNPFPVKHKKQGKVILFEKKTLIVMPIASLMLTNLLTIR